VVSASKSGAVSLMRNDIVNSLEKMYLFG